MEADRAYHSALMHFICGIDDLEKSSKAITRNEREKLCSSAGAKFRSADYEAQYANSKKPNQTPEPTPTAGTSAAEQPLVPAAVVAHL